METQEYIRKPAVEMMDEGLRQYMIKVFNFMGLGLGVTALTAFLVANTSLIKLIYNIDYAQRAMSMSVIGWIVVLAPLALVFAFPYVVKNKSLQTTQALFWLFSALMGASLSSVFIVYTATSMVRVFLITASTFGVMALYGYTTKRDLSKIGSFCYMGLIGVIIATIVNFFMQSAAFYYALSYITVAIFVGLTAWDMQKIKGVYYAFGGADNEETAKIAISGAMELYLDFINLFLALLRIMGDRR